MNYTVEGIQKDINENFTKVYRNASKFVETELFEKCMMILADFSNIKCIIFANDFGIPPVKSMVKLLVDNGLLHENVKSTESTGIGSLMGFLFKHCFQYKEQKERIKLGQDGFYGIKSATKFMNAEFFTITQK